MSEHMEKLDSQIEELGKDRQGYLESVMIEREHVIEHLAKLDDAIDTTRRELKRISRAQDSLRGNDEPVAAAPPSESDFNRVKPVQGVLR